MSWQQGKTRIPLQSPVSVTHGQTWLESSGPTLWPSLILRRVLTSFISLTSSHRHFIISHHHEKKKSGYHPTCLRDHSHLTLITVHCYSDSTLLLVLVNLLYYASFINYTLSQVCIYRTKRGIHKGFSTIHGFRHSLEILEHIPPGKGGGATICFIFESCLSTSPCREAIHLPCFDYKTATQKETLLRNILLVP